MNKKGNVNFSEEVKEDLSLNDEGEVDVPDKIIIGAANDVFGDKIFAPTEDVNSTISEIVDTPEKATSALDKLKSNTHSQMTANILAEAKKFIWF